MQEGFAKGQSGAYDLAIVDYYLPDGSGDELTRRLAHTPGSRNMPIAIITGSYKDAVIKKCLEAGAMECMFKNEVLELTLARIKALARTIQAQKSVEAERVRLRWRDGRGRASAVCPAPPWSRRLLWVLDIRGSSTGTSMRRDTVSACAYAGCTAPLSGSSAGPHWG